MIKIYEGNYDRVQFYSIMGKYFAEKSYRAEMPYISNEDGKVWFLYIENDILIAFASLIEKKNKVELTTAYVESEHRSKGIFKELTDNRMEYIKTKGIKKEIVTATDHKFVADMFVNNFAFSVYKQTKNYYFLSRKGE